MVTILFWIEAVRCGGQFENSRWLAALARQDAADKLPPDRASVWMMGAFVAPMTDFAATAIACDTLGVSKRLVLEAAIWMMATGGTAILAVGALALFATCALLPLLEEAAREIDHDS